MLIVCVLCVQARAFAGTPAVTQSFPTKTSSQKNPSQKNPSINMLPAETVSAPVLMDPTKPFDPNATAVLVIEEVEEIEEEPEEIPVVIETDSLVPKWVLKSILYSQDRKIAFINEEWVRVGDNLLDAEVLDIQPSTVKLLIHVADKTGSDKKKPDKEDESGKRKKSKKNDRREERVLSLLSADMPDVASSQGAGLQDPGIKKNAKKDKTKDKTKNKKSDAKETKKDAFSEPKEKEFFGIRRSAVHE